MEERCQWGELRLFCETPCTVLPYPCEVTIFAQPSGEQVYEGLLRGNHLRGIPLPAGRYRVRIVNAAGLNPTGFSQTLSIPPRGRAYLHPVFGAGMKPEPTVAVEIHVTDACYSGILPLNGGITVWRNRITR